MVSPHSQGVDAFQAFRQSAALLSNLEAVAHLPAQHLRSHYEIAEAIALEPSPIASPRLSMVLNSGQEEAG